MPLIITDDKQKKMNEKKVGTPDDKKDILSMK